MVNGPLVSGSGKLCNNYSRPRRPRLGQFSSVILTHHRLSQPGFFPPSSLAKSYPMPLGQFSTRSDNTWAPCLRIVGTPHMPSAFWANCPTGSGPLRVPLLTLRRFANTWPSSSPVGWGAQVPLHSAYRLDPLQRLSQQLRPRQLRLDQHLQSLQIAWTNQAIQTPTPSDLKLGKMSREPEKGRKRLAIEESH